MAPERRDAANWDRIQELFHAAAELPSPERASFLDAECGGDAGLRQEVEELLSLDTGGASTIAARAVQTAAGQMASREEAEWIGRRVGAWRITAVLGRGGMGAVYEVERADGAYQQRAALKLMRWELNAVDGARRFAEERQILAQLEHPHIARLLDGGNTEEGLPFLVLELVEGKPIQQYVEEHRSPLEQRLRLMATVALAVHAAHRKLVIHRDLKPANILVGADGDVKLLDFGIARLVGAEQDAGAVTEDLLFSPAYASPEQVNGEPVSTAADIFALGAVLFEILTGRPPRELHARTLEEIRAAVNSQPVPLPSSVAPAPMARTLRGDLDCIVARATNPDPSARYESAERMAADLECYLSSRPVSANRRTAGYRTGKFLRRHRVASALVTCAVAGLIGAVIQSNIQARRADRRFAQVRSLANTFLFDFHDQIRDLQGSTKARESIVTTALTYLQSLAAEAGNDRGLMLEVAAAYDRVGSIQYQTGVASLGRAGEAQKSFRKAIEIRSRWLDREPSNAALHQQQAESYMSLAGAELGLLGVDKVTASYSEGLKHGERARELSNPPRANVLDTLARLYRSRELLLARSGNVRGSIENYQAALRIHEELAAREKTPDRILTAAESRQRLALAYYYDGRSPDSTREFRAALSELRGLSMAHPENRRYGRVLESALIVYGGVLSNEMLAMFDGAAAAAMYREALGLSERMAQDAADINAQRDLATAHCQLAGALADSSPQEAIREYEIGIGILTRQSKEAPGQRASDQVLLAQLPDYAIQLATAGRQNAVTEARRAVEIAESLAQGDPNSMQSLRRKLSAVKALAQVHYRLGHLALVAPTMAPVMRVVEEGQLTKITHSLLWERLTTYSLLTRTAARLGDNSKSQEWNQRFEECVREFDRRALGGPFPMAERQRIARESGLRASK